jgi:pantothenate kinase-related protein Tda10
MTAVLESIADRIDSLTPTHPVRVAVDGPDASGKTILADTLSSMMVRRDRDVIRASIDGFHLPPGTALPTWPELTLHPRARDLLQDRSAVDPGRHRS